MKETIKRLGNAKTYDEYLAIREEKNVNVFGI